MIGKSMKMPRYMMKSINVIGYTKMTAFDGINRPI